MLVQFCMTSCLLIAFCPSACETKWLNAHFFVIIRAEEAGALGPASFTPLGLLQSGAPLDGARFAAASRAFLQAALAGVVKAVRRAIAPAAAAVPEEVGLDNLSLSMRP